MEPKIWGPAFWFIIHTIAFNYPENPTFNDKRHTFEFFQNLQYVLPCQKCRKHYMKYFHDHPITPFLDNKSTLVSWTVQLHNHVNKRYGKSSKTVDEVVRHYNKVYSGNQFSCNAIKTRTDKEEWDSYSSIKNKKFYWNLLFVLVIGLVAYFYIYKIKN